MLSSRLQKGFTLIELLVVVFIIAIILSMASLNLGGRNLDDRAREEAQRLLQLFQLARDEAAITGQELGFRQDKNQYQFMTLGERGWQEYASRGPLRSRSLDEPLSLELRLDQEALPEDELLAAPQVIFYSSGEATPFILDLGAEPLDHVLRIEGNLLGQLELKKLAADEAVFRPRS